MTEAPERPPPVSFARLPQSSMDAAMEDYGHYKRAGMVDVWCMKWRHVLKYNL